MLVSIPRLFWGSFLGFMPVKSTNYCTLVPPPCARIRGISRQILYPITNTILVFAAFPASIRLISGWSRGLTNRVGRDEALLVALLER